MKVIVVPVFLSIPLPRWLLHPTGESGEKKGALISQLSSSLSELTQNIAFATVIWERREVLASCPLWEEIAGLHWEQRGESPVLMAVLI